MRILFIIIVVLLIAVVGYAYTKNPEGCMKVVNDVTAVYESITPVHVKVEMTNPPASEKLSSPAPSSPAPTATPPPPLNPPTTQNTAPNPSAPQTAQTPGKLWIPPAEIPAQANWTWTTSDGKVYNQVKITKVEADCVTILHSNGGALIAISTLPSELQQQLNYDPEAAAPVAAARLAEEKAAEADRMMSQQFQSKLVDYNAALDLATKQNKLLLLHFTGSDWCHYCQVLDKEVFSAQAFQHFSASNFILVTLDFPKQTALPPAIKQQNEELSQKYSVHSFPTLIVIDTTGKELGRTEGYAPGSGPQAVITTLQSFCKL